MRHSHSAGSAGLVHRCAGMRRVAGAEEGGVRVGELPSEHSELLGLSRELILPPAARPPAGGRVHRLASKLIWRKG